MSEKKKFGGAGINKYVAFQDMQTKEILVSKKALITATLILEYKLSPTRILQNNDVWYVVKILDGTNHQVSRN
jgi:hypothetical protein